MRKFTRRGVSPVIATIMMVVITVVLSATVVVMVMSYNSSGSSIHYGSFTIVERDSTGQYQFYFGSFQPKTLFSQVKVNIAGEMPPYSASRVASMHFVDLGGEGVINVGDSVVIKFGDSMAGEIAEVLIVFMADGSVIAGTSVIVSGGVGPIGMDLGPFVARGAPAPLKSWSPYLELNKNNNQYLMLAASTAYQPTSSLEIRAKFMLGLPPASQNQWSELLNWAGPAGYRLQLSQNCLRIEFGLNGGFVASGVDLVAGVWYTVAATANYVIAKNQWSIQLTVDDGSGTIQPTVQKFVTNTFVKNPNQPLYIGAYNAISPYTGTSMSRYFDGKIQFVTVRVA